MHRTLDLLSYPFYTRACILSHACVFATLWTEACQTPLFMGFSRQEYWSGLLFLIPGDLPDPGIEPASPALVDSLPAVPPGKPHVIRSSLYMSIPISQLILNAFPPHLGIHIFVLYISVSISTLKVVHLYHFSRFHICELIYI